MEAGNRSGENRSFVLRHVNFRMYSSPAFSGRSFAKDADEHTVLLYMGVIIISHNRFHSLQLNVTQLVIQALGMPFVYYVC
jgi:hypothetical protein